MKKYEYLLRHRFINSIHEYRHKIALIINQKEITYDDLYRDCMIFSNKLSQFQTEQGDRVLILSGNTYLTIVSFWASILFDLVPCIADPETDDKKLSGIIQKVLPKVIVCQNQLIDQIGILTNYVDKIISNLDSSVEFNDTFILKESRRTESDLLMIMHTSGSTGEPKGVMLSNRNVLSAIDAIVSYLSLKQSDVILSVLPLHFDYGLYQLLLSLSVGASIVIEESLLFPVLVARNITRYRVSVLPCVPLMAQIFFLCKKQHAHDFSSIKLVTNTGENLSEMHIQKMRSLFPSAMIYSMYGLTECKRCSYVPAEMLNKKPRSIGIPMPNLEMWIEDSEGNRCPPNHEGELMISGPTVMMGYWENVDETNKKIKILPSGKRVLISGDRAVMDNDGYFYFKGRNDYTLKYKGMKFNAFDYIQKIHQIDDVQRAYIYIDSEKAEPALIVCIEYDSSLIHQDILRKKISSVFPSMQKPDYIYFSDRFPSLSNGKINKHQLESLSRNYL